MLSLDDVVDAFRRTSGVNVRYPCGLTDAEWAVVEHIFDPPQAMGRPPRYRRR